MACRLFISVDDPMQVEKLLESFNKIAPGIMSVPIDLPGTPFNRAIKASKFIKEKLLKIMRERREELANGTASQTQDILSHMLSSCDENGQYMTENLIADKILGLLIGGHDTASSACTFVVKYLADLPPNIYENVYRGIYMILLITSSSYYMVNNHKLLLLNSCMMILVRTNGDCKVESSGRIVELGGHPEDEIFVERCL